MPRYVFANILFIDACSIQLYWTKYFYCDIFATYLIAIIVLQIICRTIIYNTYDYVQQFIKKFLCSSFWYPSLDIGLDLCCCRLFNLWSSNIFIPCSSNILISDFLNCYKMTYTSFKITCNSSGRLWSILFHVRSSKNHFFHAYKYSKTLHKKTYEILRNNFLKKQKKTFKRSGTTRAYIVRLVYIHCL